MKNSRDLKEVLYTLVISPLPEAVRNSLLLDRSFCDKLGIVPQFWFPLGREMAAETGSLHDALRKAIDGKRSAMLALRGGGRERVKLGRQRGGKATIVLRKEGFSFSDADLLATDPRTRMTAIRRVFNARPLLAEEEERWITVAEERALTDREYVDLMTALGATPEAIRSELQKPQNLNVDVLMPDEPNYYRRLIAPLTDETRFDSFIQGELATTRRMLLKQHPGSALRRIAFTALWQSLIPFDLLASVKVSDVAPLLQANDPFSLLFGFELCRYRLSADPGFVELGRSFLDKLLLEETSTQRCNIFSALALIVTIKVRQAAKASSAPLFWVRLAALGHAGVLTDALSGISDSDGFLRWSIENFSSSYVWHTVIDRRDAPRWRPDWVSSDHLYAELVGRVQGAIQMIPENERPTEWASAVEAALAKLLESGKALAAYFPGPFDDFRGAPIGSTGNRAFEEVEAKLDTASLLSDVPGLFALTYATQPSTRVVSNVQRILDQPADQSISVPEQEVSFLHLSAHIAASARSEPLANAVIGRCLFKVRKSGSKEAVANLFAIMVEACAAHSDPQKHRDLLGMTAAKLSFAIDKNDCVGELEAIFDVLAMRDEKLIPALARAHAIARTKRGRS